MDKYLQKMRAADEAIAGEIVEDRLAMFTKEEEMNAAILLGRAQAADRISVALSAEVIRFLEHFEKTKIYRAIGHKDFVTFLANSGLHGVTKHKYYERKKVLDKEGDPVFDALTVAGVPMSVRGELQAGDVQIDGDTIIVKGETEDEDLIIDTDNHAAIVQHLRNLANARKHDRLKLKEVAEKLDAVEAKYDEKVRGLYEENDRIKAAKIAEVASNPHMIARVELGLAYRRLISAAEDLSTLEKDQFRDSVLEDIADWSASLRKAYKTNSPRKDRTPDGTTADVSDEDWFHHKLASVDLDNVADDNDGDLAAAL